MEMGYCDKQTIERSGTILQKGMKSKLPELPPNALIQKTNQHANSQLLNKGTSSTRLECKTLSPSSFQPRLQLTGWSVFRGIRKEALPGLFRRTGLLDEF